MWRVEGEPVSLLVIEMWRSFTPQEDAGFPIGRERWDTDGNSLSRGKQYWGHNFSRLTLVRWRPGLRTPRDHHVVRSRLRG